jgi:hypothetical protein
MVNEDGQDHLPIKQRHDGDDIDQYRDEVEGQEDRGPRAIKGTRISLGNTGNYVTGEDEVISPDREFVVVGVLRVLQKFVDKKDAGTRPLTPDEKAPDLEALNASCPEEEWSTGLDGKPKGPWILQRLVYLADLSTLERFTFVSSTIGGRIAITDLMDAIQFTRKFRPGACAVVQLRIKQMNTRFGKRPRPFFLIVRWTSFTPEGGGERALPKPDKPKLSGAVGDPVEPISSKEALDDDIPF